MSAQRKSRLKISRKTSPEKKSQIKRPKVVMPKVEVFKKDMNMNLLILLVVLFVCFSLTSAWYAYNISKVKSEINKKSEEVRSLIENALEERDKQIEMANDK